MAADLAAVVAGAVLLVVAGELLVRGAVNLALRLGIPPLVVGLTVVAFGTSAPELLVSVQAVLAGVPDIALGNVVGSNIANVLLVVGIPAMIVALHPGDEAVRSYATMLAGTALFIALAHFGTFGRVSGLVLLAGLGLMLWQSWRQARRHRSGARGAEVPEGADPALAGWKIGLFLLLGLAGLPFGAGLLVDGATEIARAAGVSEAIIGLTLVAIGTSLPELATSVVAALRRSTELALGNVIGSNVFNLLGIVGVASLVGPIPVDAEFLRFDFWVMLAASLALGPFILRNRPVGRGTGAVFALLYAVYVALLLI